jgi:hypothetical protein
MPIVFANTADLITRALKDIGVVGFGRAATPFEIADGLQVFNLMLDELGVLREYIANRTEENFPLIVNRGVYTIGPGGNFNTVKPIKIETAYYRDVNNTDFFMDVTMTEEEYDLIPIKNLSGTPQRLWYQPTQPLGNISFDYAPDTAWTFYIASWKPFSKVTNSADPTQLVFPDGFEVMLAANLGVRLCPANKRVPNPALVRLADDTLQAVQAAYSEPLLVKNWGIPTTTGKKSSFFDMGLGEQ